LKASDQVFYAGFLCLVVTLVAMGIDLLRGTVDLSNGHALAVALILIGAVFTFLGFQGKARGA
jgi:hypothetical protein